MSRDSFSPPVDSDGDIVMTDDDDDHYYPQALRNLAPSLPSPSRDSSARNATPAGQNNIPPRRLWRMTGYGADPIPSTHGPTLTVHGVDVVPPTHRGIPTGATPRFYAQSPPPESVIPPVESASPEPEPETEPGTGMFCVACMDELSSDEYRVGCGCLYCGGCLNEVFRAGCSSMASFPPRCCGVALRISAWGGVLEEDVARRYKMVEAEYGSSRPLYCAAAECSTFIPETEHKSVAVARCPTCERETCRECRRLMDEHDVGFHRNNPRGHPGQTPVCPRPTKSEKALLRLGKENKWPRCPACRTMIERNEGCDHMECVCGVEFCYQCGELFDEDDLCGCNLGREEETETESEESSEDEEEEEDEDEEDSETDEADESDDEEEEEDDDDDDDENTDEDEEDVSEEDEDEWPDHRLAMNDRRGGGGCLHDLVIDEADEIGPCHGCLGDKVLYTCGRCRIELCNGCLNLVSHNA